MSKRLTDTEKWRDEWFGSLCNDYRIVWQYLVDSCNHAGIWKKDYRGLNFNCNTNLDEKTIKEIFDGRLIDKGNFFFIPKFLKFQYPGGLNSQKPVIVSVVKELQLNNLIDTVKQLLGNDYLTIKSKSNNKRKSIDIDKSNEIEKGVTGEKEKKVSDLIPPAWPVVEFESLWVEFVEMRTKKKKPLTRNATDRRIEELIKKSNGEWEQAKPIMVYTIDKAYDQFYPPPKDFNTTTTVHDARYSETFNFDKA